jgi:type IV secretory pathway protease TraF
MSSRLLACSRARLNRIGTGIGLLGATIALLITLFPGLLVIQAAEEQSVPFRLGLRLPPPIAWQPGHLVQFFTHALPPYYPAGSLFTKAVAAVPGDHLTRLGRDFYRNGTYLASARATDSLGRPAPLFTPPAVPPGMCVRPFFLETSCRSAHAAIVPGGALFVLGTHERSFDSRYWGYVEAPEVTGRVLALR